MQRRYRLRKIPTAARAGDAFWTQLSAQEAPDPAERSRLLREGEIVAYELVPWGSNYTFLAALGDKQDEPRDIAIYKPRQGEAPLWDFPENSLAGREVAAYLVSEALGWELVPFTILREDAPLGPGSLQRYIDYDPNYHYFNFSPEDRACLRRVALFDHLPNNADRKGGHVLEMADGHRYGVDHGVTFHTEPKLRTVLWGWAGEPLSDEETEALARLQDALLADLSHALEAHLTAFEIEQTAARCARLLQRGRFPLPHGDWPSIPWPPF